MDNVYHVPQLDLDLISQNQLLLDCWDLDLIKPSFDFTLTSPRGGQCTALRALDIGIWKIRLNPDSPLDQPPTPAFDLPFFIANIQANSAATPSDQNAQKAENSTKQPDSDHKPTSQLIIAWYLRYNHLHQEELQYLYRIGVIHISGPKILPPCQSCLALKIKRSPGHRPPPRLTKPFARLYADIAGGGSTLGSPEERSRFPYFMVITDKATRIR